MQEMYKAKHLSYPFCYNRFKMTLFVDILQIWAKIEIEPVLQVTFSKSWAILLSIVLYYMEKKIKVSILGPALYWQMLSISDLDQEQKTVIVNLLIFQLKCWNVMLTVTFNTGSDLRVPRVLGLYLCISYSVAFPSLTLYMLPWRSSSPHLQQASLCEKPF